MDVRGAARERSDGAGGGGRGGRIEVGEPRESLGKNLDRQQRGLLGRAFGGRRTNVTVFASRPKGFSGQWGGGPPT